MQSKENILIRYRNKKMVTRNRKKLFDLYIKSHTIKVIWKCGNDIVNAQRGKFVFSSNLK